MIIRDGEFRARMVRGAAVTVAMEMVRFDDPVYCWGQQEWGVVWVNY